MSKRRVAVTGRSAISAVGLDVESCLQSVRQRTSGIREGEVPYREGAGWLEAAQVKGFDPRPFFRMTKPLKLSSRPCQLGVAGAVQAFNESGLEQSRELKEEIAVLVGTGNSDLQARSIAAALGSDPDLKVLSDIRLFAEKILSGLNPLWLVENVPNMVACQVAIQLGLCGPNNTIMTDWIGGSQAVGEGYEMVREGSVPVVLAGAAESPIYPGTYTAYSHLLDPSIQDLPLVPGEGSSFVVLEDMALAVERKARVFAEIVGYSSVSFSHSGKEACALEWTMSSALDQAGWEPAQLDALNCAAGGLKPFHQMEETCWNDLFGGVQCREKCRNFKELMGNTFSVAGVLEMVLLLGLSVDSGPRRLLCNSIGFSGQAASIALVTF